MDDEIPPQITLKNNPYFEIAIDGKKRGRVVFELFDKELPITCKNFRQLCAVNILDPDNKIPSYQGSIFHRVIKDFMIQGGDFTNFDGTGGISIYGESFADESFEFEHNQMGILSMANRGPNTNGSQFFILLDKAPHLDNKHVVFGIILMGFDIIKEIEAIECDPNDKPLVKCEIVESGII
jgi:cyclophilin family peptidyl-prolyl cis-trans isomerase